MATILLPCDGSQSALLAVRHAIDEFRRDAGLHVHLLNVQPPFSAYVARHVSRELRADFHRERADEALAPARRLLDEAGVPHDVHTEVGCRLDRIADAARRLRCDRIVVGTTRKSPLVRAVENSLVPRCRSRSSWALRRRCWSASVYRWRWVPGWPSCGRWVRDREQRRPRIREYAP